MNRDILNRANASHVTVSGSLLGIPTALKPDTARELWFSGAWVHADVLEGRYAHQPGFSYSEIGDLHDLNPSRLDVHLMVEDPVAACQRLPPGLGRITVQMADEVDLAAVVNAARARAEAVWLAVDDSYDPKAVDDLMTRISALDIAGILVMLTPPGHPRRRASPDQIDEVRRLHRNCRLPIGVDGDVNARNLDELIAAGASYLVSGRALLTGDH